MEKNPDRGGWKVLSDQDVDESLVGDHLRKRSVLNKVDERKLLAPLHSYSWPHFLLSVISVLTPCSLN